MFLKFARVLAVSATLLLSSFVAAESPREQFSALAASHGGIIKLNSKTFDAITTPDRDWSVAIQMTALSGTHAKCEPCLMFKPNFESVASAWKKVPSKDRDYHFFATLDFKDGQDVFRKLGLNSAPFVHFYPAAKGPLLEAHPQTQMWTYDFNMHSFDAENFAHQLSSHTPVVIPWTKPFNWALFSSVVMTVALVASAYVLFGDAIIALLTSRWIWALGCLAFILTMVGGYMFVKIRMNPWAGAVRGRDGRPMISYVANGYQNQYGAETWITTALYSVLGASQICLIMYAPKVPSAARQRTAVMIWIAVSWMLFSVLVAIFKMKHPGYPFRLLL
ncbi:hypothetical protein M407DRAFT_243789 [Tulasnella calospora MUT 4182]|uniref:Magnesium transporter protein 1 n=1 Tax=Tulasnella calospora MUT 4182 TaxID=1051891 RepID=A0A0C3LXM0_9AGAM|nr:hypothetical protein M407DRAFT_243789 [Tulasnella calospora MUT 4182]